MSQEPRHISGFDSHVLYHLKSHSTLGSFIHFSWVLTWAGYHVTSDITPALLLTVLDVFLLQKKETKDSTNEFTRSEIRRIESGRRDPSRQL